MTDGTEGATAAPLAAAEASPRETLLPPPGLTGAAPGEAARPVLAWVPVSALRIETAYQRQIEGAGLRNVARMAKSFDWSMFGALTVAPIGGEVGAGGDEQAVYVVIDGQHRATVALALGLEAVPCVVHALDLKARAAAFAAINGQAVAVAAFQRFHALVAAGDPVALAAQSALDRAGARMLRSARAREQMRGGDTLSATTLLTTTRQHGADVVGIALGTITRTGDGHAGCLNAANMRAAVEVVASDARLFSRGEGLWADLGALDWFGIEARVDTLSQFGDSPRALLTRDTLRAEVMRILGLESRRAA